ncbi:unnamed protein product, partial [Heterotrigona itama]
YVFGCDFSLKKEQPIEVARSRSIDYIITDLKYDRSNREPAFGAFPSARR